jgi:sulfate adenylyltransferase
LHGHAAQNVVSVLCVRANGTYDAQRIFDNLRPGDLAITPLRFEHTFYCRTCASVASSRTCPHDSAQHLTLSGTKVRELLRAGQAPPAEFTRPEVARVLIDALRTV